MSSTMPCKTPCFKRKDTNYKYCPYNGSPCPLHSPPSNNTATRAGRAGSPTPAMRGPASVRRRTARPHHKSKRDTPSGETRGRASRFRLWLPDGPQPSKDTNQWVCRSRKCPCQPGGCPMTGTPVEYNWKNRLPLEV